MNLDQLAARQHGVVSRRQALDSGLSEDTIDWSLESKRWRRMHPGVYAVHRATPDWHARAWAALLHAGTGAVLAFGSAAFLHGLRPEPPTAFVVLLPLARRVKSPSGEVDPGRRDRLGAA